MDNKGGGTIARLALAEHDAQPAPPPWRVTCEATPKRRRVERIVRLQATEVSMSGKGSRARRVEATRLAYADVYRLRGAEMPPPPFGNERQDRIYAQQYAKYRRSYWHMERMLAELAEVYGYPLGLNELLAVTNGMEKRNGYVQRKNALQDNGWSH